MVSDYARQVLESKDLEQLLVLAVRVYDVHGCRASTCPCLRLLEASDEAIDQDRIMRLDEHDYAFGNRYYHKRHLPPSLHGRN